MLGLIAGLQRRTGTTFVIATHDLSVAAAAHRVIRILDGLVVADGTPEAVGMGATAAAAQPAQG